MKHSDFRDPKEFQALEASQKQSESLKVAQDARNIADRSQRLAMLAVIAGAVAAIFSAIDYWGDGEWKTSQLGVLHEISAKIGMSNERAQLIDRLDKADHEVVQLNDRLDRANEDLEEFKKRLGK